MKHRQQRWSCSSLHGVSGSNRQQCSCEMINLKETKVEGTNKPTFFCASFP